MAASSSSSSSCKYDVFLSFRGEDTRKNFVCHLYRALEQKLIFTFIDSEDLKKGNMILELLNAIEHSKLSIVVLSENYASSSWCLKELVKILECMHTKNQRVVPIFYQVDPSDIRYLKGKFGKAFANKFGGANMQELDSWRSALATVSNLSGWDSRKYPDDIELIEKIVENTLPSRDGKYDVFLSFRKSDTGNYFVSHLYNALERKAISTFIDTQGFVRGQDLQLMSKAVKESKVSIVVFSKNYASSSCCLQELVKIMECMDTCNQIVVPIFYQVDPNDVRYQLGSFGQAFDQQQHYCRQNLQIQRKEKAALFRAANLDGWDSSSSRNEAKLVEDIAEGILKTLIELKRSSYQKDQVQSIRPMFQKDEGQSNRSMFQNDEGQSIRPMFQKDEGQSNRSMFQKDEGQSIRPMFQKDEGQSIRPKHEGQSIRPKHEGQSIRPMFQKDEGQSIRPKREGQSIRPKHEGQSIRLMFQKDEGQAIRPMFQKDEFQSIRSIRRKNPTDVSGSDV